MPQQHLVITLISNDQPGVVNSIAQIVSEYKGNWLESRMTQLAGKFAGIVKVDIRTEAVSAVTEALQQLNSTNLQLHIENSTELDQPTGKTLSFELIGADRVGIVSEISQAFTEKGISIDDLETYCSSMPWSGEPLFEASGILIAPLDIDTTELLDNLDIIEDKLGVDIKLTKQL